jgi:predicted helicase
MREEQRRKRAAQSDEREEEREDSDRATRREDVDEFDVFGPVVYRMEFAEAVSCRFIVDYRIWVPSIENNDNLLKELSIYNVEQTVMRKCMFFFLVFLSRF